MEVETQCKELTMSLLDEDIPNAAPHLSRYLSTASLSSDMDTTITTNHPLHWGAVSPYLAQQILSSQPNGSFLLRKSSSGYAMSMSAKVDNMTRHFRIKHENGRFSFLDRSETSGKDIAEFVANAIEASRRGKLITKRFEDGECVELRLVYAHCRRAKQNHYDLSS